MKTERNTTQLKLQALHSRDIIAQYVGRLQRLYALKKEAQVYDYADLGVPMLERMFNQRCQGYEALGYKILLPASAIPGWPAEIPLPVDPAWNADYAGSVKRLIRDGVDMPLAHLFVQVASPIPPDAEGVNRARSATESFLFRRLETLSQTIGRFKLNAELDIPFDGWGRMELDLLCAEVQLTIELDGAQHLGNVDAYLRDRHKDPLLQEKGYTVLRFLCEDVGKRLNEGLDAILRALVRLAIVTAFFSVGHLSAFLDRESQPVDFVAYGDIKNECYHFIYSVYRNLHIWEWPDSMVKHILKTHLEDYLIGYLNTPESRKLHLKYEAVDWNIHEMMEIHLSVDE